MLANVTRDVIIEICDKIRYDNSINYDYKFNIQQMQMWYDYLGIIRPERYNVYFINILSNRGTETDFIVAVINRWRLTETTEFQSGTYCSIPLCRTYDASSDYDSRIAIYQAIINTTRAMWRMITNVVEPRYTWDIIKGICNLQSKSRIILPDAIELAIEIASVSAHLPIFTIAYVDHGLLRAVLVSHVDNGLNISWRDLPAWPIPGTNYQYYAKAASVETANRVVSIIYGA